jgi:hypothetical protein
VRKKLISPFVNRFTVGFRDSTTSMSQEVSLSTTLRIERKGSMVATVALTDTYGVDTAEGEDDILILVGSAGNRPYGRCGEAKGK